MIEHFPDPYPDEILYSVWARYSDHVGYPTLSSVHRELFGKRYVNAVVDLPCHLGYFVDHLPHGHVYTGNFFIDYHTLLPFYSPFLPQVRANRLREQMMVDSAAFIHSRAGIIGSNIPRPQWLRYCPLCIVQDKMTMGEAYWHRIHQVPGVEICPTHDIFLENSSIFSERDFTSGEFVSAERAASDSEPREATSSPFYKELTSIAMDALYLLEHPRISINLNFFRKQYHALLAQQGFLTRGGLIRKNALCQAFMEYYSPTLLNLLHCGLNRYQSAGSTWLNKLAQPSNDLLHPIQHILVIHFLRSTVEHFFECQVAPPMPFGEGPWPCLNPVCEHYHHLCIPSYRLGAHSTAQRTIGVFSCECGFTYARSRSDTSCNDVFRHDRILSYGMLWDAKLRELWQDTALSMASISRSLGAARSTICRRAIILQLTSTRESHCIAQSRKQRSCRTKDTFLYRTQWLTLLDALPEVGRTTLKKRSPGVYKWLWTHDREWLCAHLPPVRTPRRQQWRSRMALYESTEAFQKAVTPKKGRKSDAEVAEAVREAACRLVATVEPPKRITARRVSIEVPQARKLSRQADKAPLTMRAIEEVVETGESFTLRYIQWLVLKYQEKHIFPSRGTFLRKLKNLHHHLHLPAVQQALEEAMLALSQVT